MTEQNAQQWAGTSKINIGKVIGVSRYKDLVRTLDALAIHYILTGTLDTGYQVRVLNEDFYAVVRHLRNWRVRTKERG